MAVRGGRVTCARCGANNFDTVTACWKCGTPLQAGVTAQTPRPPMASEPTVERASYPVGATAYPAPSYAPGGAGGDSGVARRAAIALALTMPWIGLPVGWVFMMIEDHRKQAIGRVCAVWSLIALVFHLLFMFVALQSVGSLIQHLLLPLVQGVSKSVGGGNGMGGNGLP